MVKEQGSGQSAARVTSYLMQPWQLRRHNLSRMTPRIGWWWGWRACMSARWSIRCCALAWSSETVSGRHLQGTQQKALSLRTSRNASSTEASFQTGILSQSRKHHCSQFKLECWHKNKVSTSLFKFNTRLSYYSKWIYQPIFNTIINSISMRV